ncbi:MAG: OsmC family protein [Candidatus Omnitrophota bacterium]
MAKTEAVYEGDLRCQVVYKLNGHAIKTDAPKENGGRAEFFSPTDLVPAALASCILSVMGIVAARRSIDLKGARVEIEKEMAAPPERRIGRLATEVYLPSGVGHEYRKMLEETAMACPVKGSLHPEILVTMRFHYSL